MSSCYIFFTHNCSRCISLILAYTCCAISELNRTIQANKAAVIPCVTRHTFFCLNACVWDRRELSQMLFVSQLVYALGKVMTKPTVQSNLYPHLDCISSQRNSTFCGLTCPDQVEPHCSCLNKGQRPEQVSLMTQSPPFLF